MEANSFQNLQTTGIGLLDDFLGGGWVRGALTELQGKRGAGKLTLALRTAAHLTQQRKWVALISQGSTVFPPGLNHEGVNLHYLLWIRPKQMEECLWALEQIARSGLFPLVMALEFSPKQALLRRLQLAAEKQGTTILLMPAPNSPRSSYAIAACFRVERSEYGLKLFVLKSRKYLSQTFVEVPLNENTYSRPKPAQRSVHRIAS